MTLEHWQRAFPIVELERPDGRVLEGVRRALELLSERLLIAPRVVPTPIAIVGKQHFGVGIHGVFYDVPRHIRISLGTQYPTLSAIHEIAHAVDHNSSTDSFRSSELLEWQETVRRSDAIQRLVTQVDALRLNRYELRAHELFARCFEQLFSDRIPAEWTQVDPLVQRGSYWTQEDFDRLRPPFLRGLRECGLRIKRQPTNHNS
jgi:hypothetical protein